MLVSLCVNGHEDVHELFVIFIAYKIVYCVNQMIITFIYVNTFGISYYLLCHAVTVC